MAYVCGHRGDYHRWASRGLSDWSYEKVLPYFRRQETWEGGADAYRGDKGPLNIEANRYPDSLCDAFTAAGVKAGNPLTADHNGAQQEGFGAWQTRRRHGVARTHPLHDGRTDFLDAERSVVPLVLGVFDMLYISL